MTHLQAVPVPHSAYPTHCKVAAPCDIHLMVLCLGQPTTQVFIARMPFLPSNQQCQSTEGKSTSVLHLFWILSGTTRMSWYQNKHSPIHIPVQFACLRVFAQSLPTFSLVYLLVWHPPLQTRTFLHPIIVFFPQRMSIQSQPVLP